ncbi:signal transduction histidine kinase [Scopulibacillus darangshiensis]|uniref:histidine kinase n=1 Tax=Scopulibacillus darangshiensis TaxID=442528 RepID=A0A4R2NI53_9BACL|nr:signal transduction histidine kinase [Scopulibacillus darangshiensis]
MIHLILSKKILYPLNRLSDDSNMLNKNGNAIMVNSKDEVGQIADRMKHLSRRQNQMMDGLAHELRTPLTTLNGYLEGLESGVFEQSQSVYALLRKECVQLTDVVENMHDLQAWKDSHIDNQWIEIKHTVASAVLLFQDRFDELNIDVDMQVESKTVYCDPKAVQAILAHLFDNVIRYDVGKKVVIKGKQVNHHFKVSVSNQGRDIPEEVQDQLFDPFFRVEASRNRRTGGSGLGLAIVKEIVKKLNGKVGFYSEHDFYTFCFFIPESKESNKEV